MAVILSVRTVKAATRFGRTGRGAYGANGDILFASLLEDLGNDTILLELKVHLSLVSLNLDEDFTRAYSVARLLLPSTKVTSLHGRGQGRHLDNLVFGERGITADDVSGEAIAQGTVRRGENSPPESGAEHLGRVCVKMARNES